ncbi:hypothetical protein NKH18_48075 [Streptomyces sp. M10(2022)]
MPDLARPTTGVSRRHTHTGDEPTFVSSLPPARSRPDRPRRPPCRAPSGIYPPPHHSSSASSRTPPRRQRPRGPPNSTGPPPGASWPTGRVRWQHVAAALGCQPLGLGEIIAADLGTNRTGQKYSVGVRALFCLRVVQPTLLVMKKHNFNGFPDQFIAAQNDPC